MSLTIKSRITIPSSNRNQFSNFLNCLSSQLQGVEITFNKSAISGSPNHEFWYTITAETRELAQTAEEKIQDGGWAHYGG